MWVKDAVQTSVALGALCILLGQPSTVAAHVQPSRDVNNRYLKLTPTTDRVRLAYTVYIGEEPGKLERKRLDRDQDGLLSDAEAAVFRDRIAQGVEDTIAVELDGAPYALRWTQTYIGLGTPTTDAGSFSIDLIAWVCLPRGQEHQLVLRDRFRIQRPGETEVRIETSPDVRVTRSSLGPKGPSMMEMKWLGGPGLAATEGIHLTFQVESSAPTRLADDDVCSGKLAAAGAMTDSRDGDDKKRRPLHWAVGAIMVLLLLFLAGLLLAWRRRAR